MLTYNSLGSPQAVAVIELKWPSCSQSHQYTMHSSHDRTTALTMESQNLSKDIVKHNNEDQGHNSTQN